METPSTPQPQPKPRNKGGRPTRLTPAAREVFLKRIRLGMSEAAAARIAGFAPNTLLEYKQRDPKLIAQMEFERAKLQEELTVKALKGSGDSPRDARETLAMHFPREFNPRIALEISGRDGGAIHVQDDSFSRAVAENPKARDAYYTILSETYGPDAKIWGKKTVEGGAPPPGSSQAQPPPAKASALLRPALPPGVEDAEKLELELWVPPDPGYEEPWAAGTESALHPARNVTPQSHSDDDPDGELI